MTQEQKKKIKQLRQFGYGYATIADALGLTKNQVAAYCRRNALTGTKAASHNIDRPDTDCCLSCGKALTQQPGKKKMKFCSNACRVRWWNSHPEKVNKKAIYHFSCACCGKEFTAYGNAHRKYCSHSCYIADRFGQAAHDRGAI